MTGQDLRLTGEQVALVRRLQSGQFGDMGFNPYEVGGSGWPCWGGVLEARAGPQPLWPSRPHLFPQPAVDFFSGDVMIHPVTNRPADKRSFIPSLVEKEKVGPCAPGAWPGLPAPCCLS